MCTLQLLLLGEAHDEFSVSLDDVHAGGCGYGVVPSDVGRGGVALSDVAFAVGRVGCLDGEGVLARRQVIGGQRQAGAWSLVSPRLDQLGLSTARGVERSLDAVGAAQLLAVEGLGGQCQHDVSLAADLTVGTRSDAVDRRGLNLSGSE